MPIDRMTMMFAEFIIFISLGLGFYVSSWWRSLVALTVLNLLQAVTTGCRGDVAVR